MQSDPKTMLGNYKRLLGELISKEGTYNLDDRISQ
jgi:hypothetical protein